MYSRLHRLVAKLIQGVVGDFNYYGGVPAYASDNYILVLRPCSKSHCLPCGEPIEPWSYRVESHIGID